MGDENQAESATQAQEVKPAETTVAGKKSKSTGNFLMDVAAHIENLTEARALKEAASLADDIEANYFRLGGVLALIKANTWFGGYDSFATFVFEKFGFKERKAEYLIEIYTALVNKSIPWEKVQGLGWTKLKDLAKILTVENVDEWVEKAKNLTVLQLQAILAEKVAADNGPGTTTASDGIETVKYRLKADQAAVVKSAVSKAMAEIGTEFETSALEAICSNYLSGGSINTGATAAPQDLTATVKNLLDTVGLEPLLGKVSEFYPEYDIGVTLATPPAATAEAGG